MGSKEKKLTRKMVPQTSHCNCRGLALLLKNWEKIFTGANY